MNIPVGMEGKVFLRSMNTLLNILMTSILMNSIIGMYTLSLYVSKCNFPLLYFKTHHKIYEVTAIKEGT